MSIVGLIGFVGILIYVLCGAVVGITILRLGIKHAAKEEQEIQQRLEKLE